MANGVVRATGLGSAMPSRVSTGGPSLPPDNHMSHHAGPVEHLRNGSDLISDSSVRRGAVSVRGDLMKKPLKWKRKKIGSTRFAGNLDMQFLGLTPEGIEIDGRGVVRNLSMRGALIETHYRMETDD